MREWCAKQVVKEMGALKSADGKGYVSFLFRLLGGACMFIYFCHNPFFSSHSVPLCLQKGFEGQILKRLVLSCQIAC